MGDNVALRQRITQLGLKYRELSDRINDAIQILTGRRGKVTERTIHDWVSGATIWPQERQRRALEAVFECGILELGFTPRGRTSPAPDPPEPPVNRRQLMSTGSGATAALAAPGLTGRPPAVGSADVTRLRDQVATLVALDDQRGGHDALARAALAGADQAMTLHSGRASERIRRQLLSTAADFTATAAWSCIDARRLATARTHLDRALSLAGRAQDTALQFRVWNFLAVLAAQRQDWTDAVACAQAAQATGITRRDPMYASLGHARAAIGHAAVGSRQAALRCLGHAQEALARTDPGDGARPAWLDFYGPSELHALSAIVHKHIGDHDRAEAHGHRALGAIGPRFRRNRASVTAWLAIAQLGQGEVDQACATATSVYAVMSGDPIPPRLRTLMGDFHRTLITIAPDATATREWTDHIRTGREPAS